MRGNGSGNGKIGVKIGEQFVPMTRGALDRLRTVSDRARRFVLFLMSEHLSHGGQDNGYLKAPHRQLAACGMAARNVRLAIDEAEEAGLVECYRGGMRTATLYRLTWLPVRRDETTPAAKPSRFEKQKSAAPRDGR
jgi:hypothetical protein